MFEVCDRFSLYVVFRYKPREYYEKNRELKQCIDEIASGFFSPEDPALFRDLASALLNHDRQVLSVSQPINQSTRYF